MRKHLAVLKLSPEGIALVNELLAQSPRLTYSEIAARVLAETGSRITISNLSRYYHGLWKARLDEERAEATRRNDWVAALMAAFKGGAPVDRLVDDLLKIGVVMNREKLTDLDPVDVLNAQTKRERVKIEGKRVEIEGKKVELEADRVRAESAGSGTKASAAAGLSDAGAQNIRKKILTEK